MLSECCGGGGEPLPDVKPGDGPKFKVIMLGDYGCGKTCLLSRFTENTFPEEHVSRHMQTAVVSADVTVGRESVRLILWDTGGQEKFRCLTTSYYRDAMAAPHHIHAIVIHNITHQMLVYDITNRESFENIQHWRQQIALYASTIDIILLIGTKIFRDSCFLQVDAAAEERRVTPEEGQALAETMRAQFAETSSKEGTNTGVCLAWVAAKCLNKFRE
ncbi:Ras subfamily protein [Acanthamoeba castellanii str. Neff]|uniref:Ras subfamily protein n=1 Tax=Acanthamoeba castellanii (strain ATCC 30010 / Neff) TaxID=1257118 RepID=L8GY91_ACACF|nr:Ras subfamily protein [Acanthamoeba castellanii str. Neff]ELR18229.1 Ras subfamily protein [Acanthamoeba castellanii str. Neff]